MERDVVEQWFLETYTKYAGNSDLRVRMISPELIAAVQLEWLECMTHERFDEMAVMVQLTPAGRRYLKLLIKNSDTKKSTTPPTWSRRRCAL